jgi:hypothetical protein
MDMVFIMQASHLLGCTFMTSGSFLQQMALYRKSIPKMSSARDCSSSSATMQMFYFAGLFLEMASLMLLPMGTYVLLGSLHVIFFKLNLANDENRPHALAEVAGNVIIILSLL